MRLIIRQSLPSHPPKRGVASFTGIRLTTEVGIILIMGKTSRRVSIPISCGLQHKDLDASQQSLLISRTKSFAAWPERLDSVCPNSLARCAGPTERKGNDYGSWSQLSTICLGNNPRDTPSVIDKRGEVRWFLTCLLDQDGSGSLRSSTLDYLQINRFLGRQLLGWFSLALITVALSIVLAYQARPTSATTTTGTSQPSRTHYSMQSD